MTETATPTRRGRPRPDDTIERDNQVLKALQSSDKPLTRNELAAQLGLDGKIVYLSLYRLSRGGQITRGTEGRGQAWAAVASE
jgi:predicted transcriptional regulator